MNVLGVKNVRAYSYRLLWACIDCLVLAVIYSAIEKEKIMMTSRKMAEIACENCRAECGRLYRLLEQHPATPAGDTARRAYEDAQKKLSQAYRARPKIL